MKPTRDEVIKGADKSARFFKKMALIFLIPLAGILLMTVLGLASLLNSANNSQQQQNNVAQQQTTEVPTEKPAEAKTKTPAKNGEESEYTVTIGSNDIEQEEGWVYIYEYTLDGKTIGVEEMNGWPVNIINWGENVKEKDFKDILNSPKTVKKFIEKQQLAE